ncbi:MBL fold metallo-hydrolase [Streptomyces olindensis]|uniref:MBL fold metallo-hydrolase n=1 Tax=Streptomyces olindensis TaxID=358823 RepID=UPI0036AF3C80
MTSHSPDAFVPAEAGANETLPDYAPIPPSAFGPPLNELGYHVGAIGENLYWVTDGSYQAMFLTTRSGVVLVDAPPTIGHNLLRSIDEVTHSTGKPSTVTHLVYSHGHADHIGAAGIFSEDVERIAHVEADRLLKAAGDPNRPRPTTTFDDRYILDVGGERLELTYHGPNHTADNIFINATAYETLFVVDVMYPGWAPFQNLAFSTEIPNWVKAHRQIMEYPWTTFLGGHMGRLGTRADGELLVEYVEDLTAHATEAIASVDPTPYFGKYGPSGNSWAMMKHYWAKVAQEAAQPVIAKYTGRLAGVDASTVENAFIMVTSLMHDRGVLPGALGIRP